MKCTTLSKLRFTQPSFRDNGSIHMAEMKRDVRRKWDVETVKKNMISQAPRRDEPEPLQTAHAEDSVHLGEQETGNGVDSYSGEDGGEKLTRVTPVFSARNPIMSSRENFWV